MKNHKDVLVDGSDYKLSLVKLLDRGIQDIHGYVSHEFGEPVFKVTEVVFDDGTEMGIEGEHDLAYLVNYADAVIRAGWLEYITETDKRRGNE